MQSDKRETLYNICDAIRENPRGKPATCQQANFAEIKKIILKLLCFSLLYINFEFT